MTAKQKFGLLGNVYNSRKQQHIDYSSQSNYVSALRWEATLQLKPQVPASSWQCPSALCSLDRAVL